ncbi:hypothetical protein [Methylocucumis oryzae]|uniref:Uncharacterized protein n=1 Tax=Methylocucumis oryzae TaxID=1632867 RepID=A0A0F3IJP0_9GAMM|nr:hypothetical protein [Methylocucumis oryzae]KJV06990.1 hypothetical protein VZ94_07760 [Methylocucumis oryzae]
MNKKNIIKLKIQFFNVFLWLLLSPVTVLAHQLAIEMNTAPGGKVVLADHSECVVQCVLELTNSGLVSLFATPEPGYQFHAWGGACANTLGPLCTLAADQNLSVSVSFKPNNATENEIKALLLVPEPGVQATVWNEFVSEYFANQCPTIYGGVLLENDAMNPVNQVYCYRLTLGYYSLFAPDLTEPVELTQLTQINAEIRAALLGIMNKHPNLSVTIVAQGLSGLAAQKLLNEDDMDTSLIGVLSLASQTKLMQQHSAQATFARFVNR